MVIYPSPMHSYTDKTKLTSQDTHGFNAGLEGGIGYLPVDYHRLSMET